MRITEHPILESSRQSHCKIEVDGEFINAVDGEPIAAALIAAGKVSFAIQEKDTSREVFFVPSDNAQTV